MVRRRIIFVLLLLCVLAASCGPAPSTEGPTATAQLFTELPGTATPLPTITPTSIPPSPVPTMDPAYYDQYWEDRSIFEANLISVKQNVLEQFPMDSVYHIDLTIPDDLANPLTAHLEVRYFNLEDQPLDEIIFRLFANYNGGDIVVSNVTVDQNPVSASLEASDTTLVVPLDEPLAIGSPVVIAMDFSLKVPTELGGNYGLLSYIDDILVLDSFYPMIPVFDENGWYRQMPSPAGDLSYNDMSYYLVNVDAPEEMVLAATGSMVEQSTGDGRQQAEFAAGPARDFYLAGSPNFTVLSTKVGETTINSYALVGHKVRQREILDYLASGMNFFNQEFNTYPYTEFDAVSSPMNALGIEYPGITGLFEDLYYTDLGDQTWSSGVVESVVVHELGHAWFYNLVGNDQQRQPWVDESVTQYIVYLYLEAVRSSGYYDGLRDSWYGRWARVNNASIAIGMPVADFPNDSYSAIVYGRGPLFYYTLAQQIGEDTVVAGLVDYLQQNAWQIGTTESLRANLEKACGCDLSEIFDAWIYP